MKAPNRQFAGLVAILCAVAVGMLLYALFGKPEYLFFGQLKTTVSIASVSMAVTWLFISWKLVPVSILYLANGYAHQFGKHSREDWIPYNWTAVALLAIGALTITFIAFRTKPETQE